MVISFLILCFGLTPSLVTLWCLRRSHPAAQARFRHAVETGTLGRRDSRAGGRAQPDPNHHYVEGLGWVVGDILCEYNARSPYLRCAPNPSGPCAGCLQYRERDLG